MGIKEYLIYHSSIFVSALGRIGEVSTEETNIEQIIDLVQPDPDPSI